MVNFRYPLNDLDDPSKLLGVLGSFWATTYQGNDLLEDIQGITGQAAKQTYLQFMELVNSVSRHNIPLYHQENWYGLTIKESEVNASAYSLNQYKTPTTLKYESQAKVGYGDLIKQEMYAVEKPKKLKETKVIFNRLTDPSVQLVNGIDFWIQDDVIVLREDPFKNPLIPKRDLINNRGEIVDRECVLWLYQGKWDWNYIHDQFGYVLQLRLKTSQGYKDFINAIFDAFVEGTSIRTQQQAISVAFGIPTIIEAEETVEYVKTDSRYLNIITDRHVYQFPKTAKATVYPGDQLKAGDTITDLLEITELNAGENTAQLDSLAVGEGFISSDFWGDIVFENKDVPLQVEENVDGYTKVTWQLGGFEYDTDKFWDDIHKKGVAKNETLAMLLDVRDEPIGQPTAAALPATINPLKFLIENIFRYNTWLVKIKLGVGKSEALEYVPTTHLRRIQPPHTVMLLSIELAYQDRIVMMNSPGTPENPGYQESVEGFPMMTISETIDADSFITEQTKITKVGGRCI